MFTKAVSSEEFILIEKMAEDIWHQHYTPIIGSAQVKYMLKNFQTAEKIESQVRLKDCHYYIIKERDSICGYFAVEYINRELFLSKFYLLDSARGKGFGRRTMDYIENLALKKNIRTINLTVNKSNPAVVIYEKLGFYKKASICTDVGGGFFMDDYIMEKDLSDKL